MELNPKTSGSEWKLVERWAAWDGAHGSTGSRHGNVRKLNILLATFNATSLVYRAKKKHLSL